MKAQLIIGPTIEHAREEILYEIVSGSPAEMIRKTAAKFEAWDDVL